MRLSSALLLVLSASIVSLSQDSAKPFTFDGKSWWQHVKVLADDNMEGRDTGSEGLRRASAYVIEQIKKDGLQPAGTDGYLQSVKFRERRLDEAQSSLSLVRDGKEQPLVIGDDAIFSTRIDLAPEVDAPLVFVGYGLKVPELNYDDFAGLDLKGKVAVVFSGSPADMPAPLASHYQSAGQRWKALKEAGAIGVVGLLNPAAMEIPWERVKSSRTHPSMAINEPALDETKGEQISVHFNPVSSEKLFEGSGHTFAEIADLGKMRKPLPKFPLAVSIKARTKLIYRELESSNIVAKLPGSDPKLKNQYVVLSAHIDHVGIGEPINGDKIYNGAMDNASGAAMLMDLAASLKQHPEKLRRSVLFVWVTGEEKGLLGSRYFATHPTVPRDSMVADLNTDMFLPLYPLNALTVYGLDESDLGDEVRAAAAKWNVEVQPDPEPLRNLFIRSDQYNFIREGVPALAMKIGFKAGSPEEQVYKKWINDRYHAPSDDLNQPVDIEAAGKFEGIYRTMLIDLANSNKRPEWKPNSFFRRFANQTTAAAH